MNKGVTVRKGSTTLRLSEERLRLIRAIAGYENRSLTDIFEELTGEYIDMHRETLALLGVAGFADECREGLKEIEEGGGKALLDLDG
jgi:predicted transcriptional regulator